MKNLIAISLSPLHKKQLKKIIVAVMPNFTRIRIKSDMVILRKTLFGRKERIELRNFLLEILPKEINRFAQSKDIESLLSYFGNSVEFLLHLDAIGERNLIAYLWKCYTHIITLEQREDSPILQAPSRYVINSKVTTNVTANKVVRNLKRMRKNIKRTYKTIEPHNSAFDVVYRSPDIRGSPNVRTYLAQTG